MYSVYLALRLAQHKGSLTVISAPDFKSREDRHSQADRGIILTFDI